MREIFGNHVTVHPSTRPSAPRAKKVTQSMDMATQMQLDVILAGYRIATRLFCALVE